jgi:hypothetical protein
LVVDEIHRRRLDGPSAVPRRRVIDTAPSRAHSPGCFVTVSFLENKRGGLAHHLAVQEQPAQLFLRYYAALAPLFALADQEALAAELPPARRRCRGCTQGDTHPSIS